MVSPENHFIVGGILCAIVTAAIAAQRLSIGRWMSIPLLCILGGMFLSNLGVLPDATATYDFVLGYVVPVAIPLLLFKADLRRIVRETGRVLIAYVAGVVGVLAGAVVGFLLVYKGPAASDLAAIFASAFIGGSVNFLAVASALEFDEPIMLAAALTTEGVMAILYLMLLLSASSARWLHRWFVRARSQQLARPDVLHSEGGVSDDRCIQTSAAWDPLGIMLAITVSIFICAVGMWAAAAIGFSAFALLFITAGAVLVANVFPRACRKLRGDYEFGALLLYFFFATVGARVQLSAVGDAALPMMTLAGTIILVHVIVVFSAGRLFRLSLPELLIGSNACVLGPPTAAAMAAGRGWPDLVTPGMLCGMLGYVIASFVGMGLGNLLS